MTLKRMVEGEYAPRYYTMTGRSFEEMLAMVKALPSRKYEDYPLKAWLIRQEGIKVLRELGLTIEQDADVRLHGEVTNTWRDNDIFHADMEFQVRTKDGSFVTLADMKPLTFPIVTTDVALVQSLVNDRRKAAFPNRPDLFFVCDGEQALGIMAHYAALEAERQARERFKEAKGKERSLDAWKRGRAALKFFLQEESTLASQNIVQLVLKGQP